MPLDWDDIKDSIRLDEVIDALGFNITEVIKGEHWASCPLPSHPGADRKPSFSINEDTFQWHCFTCNDGGQLPFLVMRLRGITWEESVRYLLPYSDGPTSEENAITKRIARLRDKSKLRPEIKQRKKVLPYFSERVLQDLEPVPIDILAQWYVDRSTAAEFNLRYDPERDRRGKYTGPAMIIPHYFEESLVGYQERWLGERPVWLAKYTNTDDFPKRYTLYNYDRARESTEPVLVVESVMTVVRLASLGYPAVGTFGVSVTPEQIKLLRGFQQGLVLSTDNDAPGQKQRDYLIGELYRYVPLQVIPSPDVEKGDLADISEDDVRALWLQREPAIMSKTAP